MTRSSTSWLFKPAICCVAVVLAACSSDDNDDPPPLSEAEKFAADCAALATKTGFPNSATVINTARVNEAGATSANNTPLPTHCFVEGTINDRTGLAGVDATARYRIRFQLRLPMQWNGRFMFQGGGGTQGSVPQATGNAGTASPTLAKGFAVVSENGGHENSDINPGHEALPGGTSFFADPQAVRDWGYGSVDETTKAAKYLISQMYGQAPSRSYFVGCSTSGRQGMAMSQMFPTHFDGIVAGDPFFVPPAISLSEVNGVQAVKAISPVQDGKVQYYLSYSQSDMQLFTKAILQACDARDGVADGVIDDNASCNDPTTGFDPATWVFTDTGQALQCAGAKNDQCLSPGQVEAIKRIARGPRDSNGNPIVLPDGTMVTGYPYDGGWMAPSGLPSRNVGTPTQEPGNLRLGAAQIPLFWYTVPEPSMDVTLFDWDTDVAKVVTNGNSPAINRSTDLGIFRGRGGKMIFYHGLSDGGPPVTYTVEYYNELAARYGGIEAAKNFARLYLIPGMGHCSGGPATDQFDFLTPLIDWVENGVAPDTVIARGTNFDVAPATRSRPLCTYPKVVRYAGPMPATQESIANASSYVCQ